MNKTIFWKTDVAKGAVLICIVRSGRLPDVKEGLSHMPHVIFDQARMHDFYFKKMQKSAARFVLQYSRRLAKLERDADASQPYPAPPS